MLNAEFDSDRNLPPVSYAPLSQDIRIHARLRVAAHQLPWIVTTYLYSIVLRLSFGGTCGRQDLGGTMEVPKRGREGHGAHKKKQLRIACWLTKRSCQRVAEQSSGVG